MNMAELSSLLAQSFGWILRSSWQAGVLIVAVLMIQRLLSRQLSAGWRFSLWLIVVVRLLLPFSAESSFSVFNLVARGPAVSTAQEVRIAEPKPIQPSTKATATSAHVEAVESKAAPVAVSQKISDAEAAPVSVPNRANVKQLPPVAPKSRALTGWEIAAWLWLVGVIGLLMHVTALMIGMFRKVRWASQVEDEAVLRLFETCRQQMNVRTRLTLLETDIVKSPALFGVFRPNLLLPLGMVHRFSEAEVRHVFLHELAHVKRRDVSLNWLLTGLQILHWFNPVIWFGFARMRADRELACDALAISVAGESEAKAYGRTIIKQLETLSNPARLPGLVGIMEDKSQMKRRILTIARFKKRGRWSILALGLMAAIAATGLTDAVKTAKAEVVTPAKQETADTMSILILDAQSGKPVRGASVVSPFNRNSDFDGPPPIKPADETGRIILPRSEASKMDFGVLHPEYAPIGVTWNWARHQNTPQKASPEIPREYTVRLDRGVEIGGTVVDENGKPLSNVRVEIKGLSFPMRDTDELTAMEHPFYQTFFGTCPVTDENGRWTCAHFPREIELIQIFCVRPDHSCVQFHTEKLPWFSSPSGELISKVDIHARTAVFVLKKGVTVRGVVVDADGNPLGGISLKETDARSHSKPLAEIVTGKDGRFDFPDRDPHQILIKATGAGYGTNPTVVNIEQGMPEVRIQMTKAVPLRVRVVNESGQPLSKVRITPTLNVGWKGVTDADGRIVWNDPPTESLKYWISAEDHGKVFKSITPGETEQVIQIHKGEEPCLPAIVRVQTEEKEPVKTFTVSISEAFGGPRTESLGEGKEGIFNGIIPKRRVGSWKFRLKIEAPGFVPFETEKLSDTTDVDVSVSLSKMSEIVSRTGLTEGVVLLPDGNPAVGAKLLVPEVGESSPTITLLFGGANSAPDPESSRVRTVRVDATGRYSLPAEASDHFIVVIHANGFAETTLSQVRSSPEIRLQPWGRLEGTYLMNSQPKENARLSLQPIARPGYRLWMFHSIDTDKDGKFQSGKLPPGEYILYTSSVGHGQPQNHRFPLMVKAGEPTKVTYACAGRTITGRVRLSAPDVEVDWMKEVEPQRLTARGQDGRGEPVSENYVRSEDYLKAFEQWRTAISSSQPDTYEPVFDSDGSFRIEGVPEGAYDLELGITKRASERANTEKPIGTLTREIIVPPGSNDVPLDVGALEMPVQADLLPKRPSAALTAKYPDGKDFNLTQYRGKLVALTFWAPWAKPSTDELAQWKSLSEAFGTHSSVALIGVELSDKPGVPAQSLELAELQWKMVQLEGRNKASVTEAWGVDSLPATFLVSPEGWIIARDLKPARLRALIQELLQKNK